MSEICWRWDVGRLSYVDGLALQRRLVAARQNRSIPDVLVFVEHPPTYTIGRGGVREHLLADEATLARLGVQCIETDRGGDITFHGPGQIVGYPIVDLRAWKPDVHAYLRALEALVIEALEEFGIHAGLERGLTGVWYQRGKLAAFGVRVSRWTTSHGFALNVSTNLEYFKHIVPCGIVDRAVTSMESVLQAPVALGPVRDALASAFALEFDRDVLAAPEGALGVGSR